MTTERQEIELMRLADEWERKFSEVALPLGFPVGVSHVPMLRRCLDSCDPSEFQRWHAKALKELRKQNAVW